MVSTENEPSYQQQVRDRAAAVLVAARREKGLSQDAVAEAAGVSQVSLSEYERAVSSMSLEVAVRLCRFYNVTMADLVGERV